jgi:DNA-binding response OmpR family regulator
MRILIIEDEFQLTDLMKEALKQAGFQSDVYPSAGEAELALQTSRYDAVVLDLGLPDGRGEEFLAKRRKAGDKVPILILTAAAAVQNRIDCLNAGADDYMVKPFDIEELIARIRALLRRPEGILGVKLTAGNVLLDTVGRQVSVRKQPISLSRRELAVLEHLLRRAGRVVPKEVLENTLYDSKEGLDSNPIPVHIHNLRKKLSETQANVDIHTLRGVGYILNVKP